MWQRLDGMVTRKTPAASNAPRGAGPQPLAGPGTAVESRPRDMQQMGSKVRRGSALHISAFRHAKILIQKYFTCAILHYFGLIRETAIGLQECCVTDKQKVDSHRDQVLLVGEHA